MKSNCIWLLRNGAFAQKIFQMIPACFLKSKPSPPWTKKSYRLTKFPSGSHKKLTDERSSQHRVFEVLAETGRIFKSG
jgi:hypothetical protein